MSERVTISMDEKLKAKLDAISVNVDISVSNIVRKCIAHSLDEIAEKFRPVEVVPAK